MTRLRTLTFKVTPDEEALIRRFAESEHRTVSEYLRAAAMPAKKTRRAKIVFKRHPVSGGWYNAAPPPRIPTQAELDDALKDYL